MALPIAVFAYEPGRLERAAILDAARPMASTMAGQSIRFKVDRLNVDENWAVLVGETVSATGKGIDWRLAEGCEPELDRMLWVVLNKHNSDWEVKHINICASEPPYWYLEDYGGFVWPCGVYAGLEDGRPGTMEGRCRKQRARKR